MNILWLVTARGGSKGVPRKNLREIGGRSLLAWKVAGARAAGALEIVLSTEDTAIAAEGAERGCRILTRPVSLASDTATSASVVRHALEALWMATGTDLYTHVMLLEPSAPFTRPDQYQQAIAMAETRRADAVIGMRAVEPSTLYTDEVGDDGNINHIARTIHNMRDQRRQARPVEWTPSASVYLFRTDMFLRTGDIYGGGKNYGLLCDRYSSIEIDTIDDLAFAEFAYERGLVGHAAPHIGYEELPQPTKIAEEVLLPST